MPHSSVSSPLLRRLGLCVVVGLIALSIAGCVRLLEPRTSDATYYLLHDPEDWSPPSTDSTGLTVGLRQPRLASYLGATRIVTRRGPHEVHYSEFHRWAEDLNRGINHTVALALAAQPGIQQVETVPWQPGRTFDYVIQLHVLSFEGVGPPPDPDANEDAPVPTGQSRMVVQWTIHDPASETLLARGLTRHQEDGWRINDYEALASHLGEGLKTLARDVGGRLAALRRP